MQASGALLGYCYGITLMTSKSPETTVKKCIPKAYEILVPADKNSLVHTAGITKRKTLHSVIFRASPGKTKAITHITSH